MFCDKVKEFLSQNKIDFTDRNITADETALTELEKLGYMTTPVTLIDGEVVVGFDVPKLRKLLLDWVLSPALLQERARQDASKGDWTAAARASYRLARCIQSGLPQFLFVDLLNQQRNGFVQIPVVDLCEQPPQDRHTESFRLNNPDELGPARIKWRKDVVVVDRQGKERANPLPVVVRVEFGHRKFRLDS